MKITWNSVRRLPRWPAWAVALAAGWLALVLLTVVLMKFGHYSIDLCLFHRVTGLSCPTCGTTRGSLLLLHGQIGSAILHNPLLFVAGGLFAAVLLVRVVSGKQLSIQLAPRERTAAWGVAAVLFLTNWAWVIFYNR